MEEEVGFRRFLNEVRDRAKDIANQLHVSVDARNVIKDFIEIANQTERLLGARQEASGDMRVLTKRYDALKQEHRQLQNRLEKLKETLTQEMVPLLKSMTAESNQVAEKGQQLGDTALQDVSTRMKASVKKLVEVLTKL